MVTRSIAFDEEFNRTHIVPLSHELLSKRTSVTLPRNTLGANIGGVATNVSAPIAKESSEPLALFPETHTHCDGPRISKPSVFFAHTMGTGWWIKLRSICTLESLDSRIPKVGVSYTSLPSTVNSSIPVNSNPGTASIPSGREVCGKHASAETPVRQREPVAD